jgi:hypothetical protein
MKYLTLLLLLIPCFVYAQKKKSLPPLGPPTPAQERIMEIHDQCYNSHKYTADQRRAFFPFNNAVTIKLVSFSDTVRIYTPIAVDNFAVDYSKVIENKVLSSSGIDSLTDILYNVGFTPYSKIPHKKGEIYELEIADPGAACYEPRNAILFINAEGKVTQYIEICFMCQRYYLSSSKIKYTVYCDRKYDLLKSYFLAQGIKYGTIFPKREE